MIAGDGPAEHLDFVGGALRGSRPLGGNQLQRLVQQQGGHGAAGGGVADAHFPGDEDLYPLPGRFTGGGDAGFHGGAAFRRRHGGTGGDIPGAPADHPAEHPGFVVIGGDTHVDDLDLRAAAPGEDIDGASAPGEVHRLIRRDVDGGGGHPLDGHPVVGAENHGALVIRPGRRAALDARQADHQGFQPAQAAGQLGAAVPPGLGGFHGGFLRGTDGRRCFFQSHGILSLRGYVIYGKHSRDNPMETGTKTRIVFLSNRCYNNLTAYSKAMLGKALNSLLRLRRTGILPVRASSRFTGENQRFSL